MTPCRAADFSEKLVRLRLIALWLISLLFMAALARGQETPAIEPTDEEPEVTIIERGTEVIEEYRLHGQLYMIKVTPKKGIPYYLVDTDGDGNLETRRGEMTETPLIPSWILFQWK